MSLIIKFQVNINYIQRICNAIPQYKMVQDNV